ncbi:MAG TPA: cupredoxin family copper-binding protein [Solirubrobacterales bacterium]|nr:cupredoxin family copper-binding protein [Solirubrobacterales bacterium]
MRTRPLLTVLALCATIGLLSIVVAGCGGGDDDGDSGSATVTETTGSGSETTEAGDDSATTEAGDDSGGSAPAPSGDAALSEKVEIEDFAYNPDPVTIEEGGKVIWINRDSAPHTATAEDGSFDTGTLEEGKLKSETFKEAGTYAYICSIHPDMHGTVEVVAAG